MNILRILPILSLVVIGLGATNSYAEGNLTQDLSTSCDDSDYWSSDLVPDLDAIELDGTIIALKDTEDHGDGDSDQCSFYKMILDEFNSCVNDVTFSNLLDAPGDPSGIEGLVNEACSGIPRKEVQKPGIGIVPREDMKFIFEAIERLPDGPSK